MRARYQNRLLEAGCDEAGRGCLAGPVFAAAVILPEGFEHEWLRDSKQLTPRRREAMRELIEGQAVAWAVAQIPPRRIDKINILRATFEAMNTAVAALGTRPGLLLIDGDRFASTQGIPYECIVRGDGTYGAIAAASILAKTHRDEHMRALSAQHPHYDWARNKGYPTAAHRAAIARHGLTAHHRKTFCHGTGLPA